MSKPTTIEEEFVEPLEALLAQSLSRLGSTDYEIRLQLLEGIASVIGGFNLKSYFRRFEVDMSANLDCFALEAERIADSIQEFPLHPAITLSILAREPLTSTEKRSLGSYQTDFRLSQLVADRALSGRRTELGVIDPSSGSGILLAAFAVEYSRDDRADLDALLADRLVAVDLSELALRGARIALSCLTDDVGVIESMWNRWKCVDSLTQSERFWKELSDEKFGFVIGNPPWEKVKVSRHEYLQSNGVARHYGAEYGEFDAVGFENAKAQVKDYSVGLARRFSYIGKGEVDLYKAFIEVYAKILAPGGQAVVILPGGLIRSKGTEKLRKFLLEECGDLSISVLDNRAKYFSIDSRVKFLIVKFTKLEESPKEKRKPVELDHIDSNAQMNGQSRKVLIGRSTLRRIRHDLSIPEVRTPDDWRIFRRMAETGEQPSDSHSRWFAKYTREVDMTRDRRFFSRKKEIDAIPVIEGRMIQAFRTGAKAYDSGTGRRAVWKLNPHGFSEIDPQFWVKQESLSRRVVYRTRIERVGFCDIAGQTNERSMMASLIPEGVVCGNKVPTVSFPNDSSRNRLMLWLGIANSFPFDWQLRRVLTTTVNYFLLNELSFPNIDIKSEAAVKVIKAVEAIREEDAVMRPPDFWKLAELRAQIDISVLIAYGLDYEDMKLILSDFPLLDRFQNPLHREERSSVTKDFLLMHTAKHMGLPYGALEERVEDAKVLGAIPYIPSEFFKVLAKLEHVK